MILLAVALSVVGIPVGVHATDHGSGLYVMNAQGDISLVPVPDIVIKRCRPRPESSDIKVLCLLPNGRYTCNESVARRHGA